MRRVSLPATFALFLATAIAELLGCWLVALALSPGRSLAWLLPAAASLAVFAALLSLHPGASGRVYAAYGGVYIAAALAWLWAVDGLRPQPSDWAGAALCLLGAAVIVSGSRPPAG